MKSKNNKKHRSTKLTLFWHRFCKNKLAVFGFVFLCILIFAAIFANVLAPYGYDKQNVMVALTGPCKKYIMGTDYLGRDLFSRMLYGARVSLSIGVLSTIVGTTLGVTIGLIAGYYGGRLENVIMRIMDVFLSVPSVLLAIAITASMGGGLIPMLVALSISSVPGLSRLVRAQVISEREKEYIEAARTARASNFRIMFTYILPNIMASIIVLFTMGVAAGILNASMLSFIGLGAQPPTPEWGQMLSEGRSMIRDYPYLVNAPGILIMLTVFSVNMMGDGLRDALDPRLKGR